MLADYLRSGDHVVIGQATGEPPGLVQELFEAAPRFEALNVFCGFSLNPAWKTLPPKLLQVSTYCALGTIRTAAMRAETRLIPCQLTQLSSFFRSGKLRADVVLLQVAPVDEEGFHSLGYTVDHVWEAAQRARVVIVEVNSNLPRTRSTYRLHQSCVVVARHSDVPLLELVSAEPNEVQLRLGQEVAKWVPDGASIQLGIGSIAVAVARALTKHRGLRVRSGMAGDWLPELVSAGAVEINANAPGMISLAAGTKSLYDWLALRDGVEFAPVDQLILPPAAPSASAMSSVSPLIAINSAFEVDLFGQANAEFADGRYDGALGGQLDYFRAARQTPGGLAILALQSTLSARAGAAPQKSRVVPCIESAYVTSPQSDVDIIVTEHGSADIRATTLAERRMLIAKLADPAFRAGLSAFRAGR